VWSAFVQDRIKNDPQNVASDFRAGSPVSNWPQNWGHSLPAPYADGTATVVADPGAGKDAITYVAAGYAKVRGVPVASLQNAAGAYTQPDEENVTIALGYATGRPDGTFTLNFTGPDPRAYFPSTYSYILAQTAGFDAGKGAALSQFLCYAVSAGQVIAPDLRYARLSKPLVDIAINAISKIPGAPPSNKCFVAGAPPPPGAPANFGGGQSSGPGSGSSPEEAAAAAALKQQQEQAAAEAKAAEEAAKRLKKERNRQVTLDAQLAQAAVANQPSESKTNLIWIVLLGALLAAGGSLAFGMRKRSAR
jgi:hypothetical protein